MPEITSLPALDLAIGLSFVFLLLSLLASAIQEWVASILALRAANLERGLKEMLEADSPLPPDAPVHGGTSSPPARKLADELYLNPMIRTLYTNGTWLSNRWEKGGARVRLPSYIAPRTFALALIDTLAPNVTTTNDDGRPKADRDVIAALRQRIELLDVPAGVKHRLLRILDNARGDVDGFRTGLETWFDDSMARVSGWYKRKTQLILVAIAAVVTLALNANALTIGNRLWHDPEVRAAVVQQAGAATGETPGGTPKEKLNNAAANVDAVGKLGVPLGWTGDATPSLRSLRGWTLAIGGWLLTVMAISLGAPFWFDTLSRLSRLRGTGKPETPLPASGRGQPDERVRDRRARSS